LFLTGEQVERRLAAVLAADIAGYSRLMGVDEEGTLARLKAARKTLVDPTIAAHRGRIVKTTGDGMLVEFASAVDATRCAIAVQHGMAEHNNGVPQDLRIEFRIGIHVGDIIIDDNDIFGDGVNIAARLEGIAEPGGICLSDDAYRQIRGKVDISVDDMGPQTLKNIAEPMRAWRNQLAGQQSVVPKSGSAASLPHGFAFPDKPSIAVLPFQNMSGDPEQEHFCDGLVEDIITTLSKLAGLRVIARNSSFVYKGRSIDIREAAKQLGVRYVLEGSVSKSGNRIRITAQLIDAKDGAHLWAERYDRAIDDVFASVPSLEDSKPLEQFLRRWFLKSTLENALGLIEEITRYDLLQCILSSDPFCLGNYDATLSQPVRRPIVKRISYVDFIAKDASNHLEVPGRAAMIEDAFCVQLSCDACLIYPVPDKRFEHPSNGSDFFCGSRTQDHLVSLEKFLLTVLQQALGVSVCVDEHSAQRKARLPANPKSQPCGSALPGEYLL